MKVIVTGANGTVGSAVVAYLRENEHTAVPWNRQQVAVNDLTAMRAFLIQEKPDALFHLAIASQSTGLENEGWIVNRQWPQWLAQLTVELDIRFLFTSSVMVFSDNAKGPFTPESVPDAASGSYGYEKVLTEQDIRQANPKAVIARIGWQIGDAPGSNNMIDSLEKQMDEQGKIRASGQWYPACSFVQDTAAVLTHLITAPPSTYLVDSNTEWTFYEIVEALNQKHGGRWTVEETADFVYDQRMLDPRSQTPPLSKRLPTLA